jgi:thiamine-phosphate pyrophosphorylase
VRLPPRLLALTPGTLRAGGEPALLAACSAALEGGLRGVLLREPALDERAFLALARALRRLLGGADGGWLGVHDRGHLALLCGADGLHLGFRSLAPAELPPAYRLLAIGLSAHAGDAPSRWAACDYLFFGPVRPTASKAGMLAPTGFDGLAHAATRAPAPLWALGGIAPEDVPQALAAGARGVATLGGILAAPDPAEAARRYAAALGAERA